MSDKKPHPVAVVSREDFERMKRKCARVTTKETAATEDKKPVKEKPVMVVATRKPLPKSLEPTEHDKEIISRAELAKQEELMEIRQANRIILTAKCNLIRAAQIAEKNELKRELSQEERKYYELMEKERQQELERAAQENRERERLNRNHVEVIEKQLEMRAKEREKQAERIKTEADYLAMMEARMKASNEMVKQQAEKRREKLKKDLQEAYEINQKIKNLDFEKERLSELKIQEFLRQKKIREEAMEAERRLKNDQRETKMLRMCQEQMQTRNSQDEKYEKWFQREAERKEREFRQKELEAAKRRRAFEAAILADREYQQREKVSGIKSLLFTSESPLSLPLSPPRNASWRQPRNVRRKSTRRTSGSCRTPWKRNVSPTAPSRSRGSTAR